MRRMTKQVQVGSVAIGGDAPVSVQSMLCAPSYDVAKNVEQAIRLENAGCDIIRVSVPDAQAVRLVEALKHAVAMPVVADIHFDYKLALACVDAGVDKIRINPGNIGDDDRVKAVAAACRRKKIPIRIGVNSGSLEKNILAKHGGPTPEALVESALYHASLLEKFDFDDIVISIKSSSAVRTYEAYHLMAERCSYPLHLGVTEAGALRSGMIKSSCAIGGLLLDGIGDTIRVSLTDDPVEEVKTGIDILKAVGLRKGGVTMVSCPTCGRTRIDMVRLVKEAERRLAGVQKDITVAIMGCVVNGPGEAKEADIGIAGGDRCGVLIKKGEIVRKVPEADLLDELIAEIERM